MDDTIVLSSDTDDSDVEIIGSSSHAMTKAELPPLCAVKVQVDDASVSLAKVSGRNGRSSGDLCHQGCFSK